MDRRHLDLHAALVQLPLLHSVAAVVGVPNPGVRMSVLEGGVDLRAQNLVETLRGGSQLLQIAVVQGAPRRVIDEAVVSYYKTEGYSHQLATDRGHLHLFIKGEDKRTYTSVLVNHEPKKRSVTVDVFRDGWRSPSRMVTTTFKYKIILDKL